MEIVNVKTTTTRTTTNWNDIWEKEMDNENHRNENRKIGSACDRRVFLRETNT